MPVEKNEKEKESKSATPPSASEEAYTDGRESLEKGFYVGQSGVGNSGPYQSYEDAQCFIDQHLDGHGTIHEVAEDGDDPKPATPPKVEPEPTNEA